MRRPALDEKQAALARAMRLAGDSWGEVAAHFGVTVSATRYAADPSYARRKADERSAPIVASVAPATRAALATEARRRSTTPARLLARIADVVCETDERGRNMLPSILDEDELVQPIRRPAR